jgi:hypothetical protein
MSARSNYLGVEQSNGHYMNYINISLRLSKEIYRTFVREQRLSSIKLNNSLKNLFPYTHIFQVVDCYLKECMSIPQLNSSKTTKHLISINRSRNISSTRS